MTVPLFTSRPPCRSSDAAAVAVGVELPAGIDRNLAAAAEDDVADGIVERAAAGDRDYPVVGPVLHVAGGIDIELAAAGVHAAVPIHHGVVRELPAVGEVREAGRAVLLEEGAVVGGDAVEIVRRARQGGVRARAAEIAAVDRRGVVLRRPRRPVRLASR